MNYKTRLVEEILMLKLMPSGAVVVEGPKWCGKTTTASLYSKSISKMNKPVFKMVLIGIGGFAYRREDGIYVVPIGCLKKLKKALKSLFFLYKRKKSGTPD